jgi:hypothetical protein
MPRIEAHPADQRNGPQIHDVLAQVDKEKEHDSDEKTSPANNPYPGEEPVKALVEDQKPGGSAERQIEEGTSLMTKPKPMLNGRELSDLELAQIRRQIENLGYDRRHQRRDAGADRRAMARAARQDQDGKAALTRHKQKSRPTAAGIVLISGCAQRKARSTQDEDEPGRLRPFPNAPPAIGPALLFQGRGREQTLGPRHRGANLTICQMFPCLTARRHSIPRP